MWDHGAATFEKAPRVHGNEPAEDPGQQQESEPQAQQVMPIMETPVRSPPNARARSEMTDADVQSDVSDALDRTTASASRRPHPIPHRRRPPQHLSQALWFVAGGGFGPAACGQPRRRVRE